MEKLGIKEAQGIVDEWIKTHGVRYFSELTNTAILMEEVVKYGLNTDVGLLINASRSVIYASGAEDFAEEAGKEARNIREQMEKAAGL